MSMEEKLDALRNRNVIHEETGIEDNGPKPTKISAVVRAQRLWDRIDLIENHLIKDLETNISNISADLNKMRNGLQEQICELSTYNEESTELLRLHESVLRSIVLTLKLGGFELLEEIPAPDLSPVSPEDLII